MLLGAVILFPALLLSTNHVTNEFLYQNIALAQLSVDRGVLGPHLPGGIGGAELSPSYNLILGILSEVTGLSLTVIQFLPIGAVVLTLAVWSLLSKGSPSRYVAGLVAIYFAYDTSLGLSIYSVFAYSWTLPLYILFLNYFLTWVRNPRMRHVGIMFMLFAGANFIHYTVPLWMLVGAFTSAGLFVFSQRTRSPGNIRAERGVSLVLAFFIFYLSFNRVFYHAVLPDRSADFVEETLDIFLYRVLSVLSLQPLHREPYAYVGGFDPLLNGLRIGQYLLLVSLVAVPLWAHLKRFVTAPTGSRWRWVVGDGRTVLPLILIVFTLGVDMVGYTLQGVPSLKFILLAFPTLGTLAWLSLPKAISRDRLLLVLLTVLALVGVAKFGATAASDDFSSQANDYATLQTGADWLFHNTAGDLRVLSDLHTLGKLLVFGAQEERFLVLGYYDSTLYAELVGEATPGHSSLHSVDYVVVNVKQIDAPLISIKWRYFEPMAQNLDRVLTNPSVSMVYTDGRAMVLRPVRDVPSGFDPARISS